MRISGTLLFDIRFDREGVDWDHTATGHKVFQCDAQSGDSWWCYFDKGAKAPKQGQVFSFENQDVDMIYLQAAKKYEHCIYIEEWTE